MRLLEEPEYIEMKITMRELGITLAALESWAEDFAEDEDKDVAKMLIAKLSKHLKLPPGGIFGVAGEDLKKGDMVTLNTKGFFVSAKGPW